MHSNKTENFLKFDTEEFERMAEKERIETNLRNFLLNLNEMAEKN
jgi:hypothetical protein